MKHYRTRRDANHKAIVDALRAIGCTVRDLAAVGGGFPDVVVGFRGANFLLEIKNPNRKGGRNNADDTLARQARFRDLWRGHCATVTSPDEAIAAVGFQPFMVST